MLILYALLAAGALSSCNSAESVYLMLDGDIEGGALLYNLADLEKKSYFYNGDGGEQKGEGWLLADALADVKPLYPRNRLIITASDGVSALLLYPLTGAVYLYQNEEGKLCAKGIDYPKVVGIKDIAEITLVTTDTATEGYKVLTSDGGTFVSRGNAKLKLFDFVVENKLGENTADKYVAAADRSVCAFTGKNKNTLYYEDYDIKKNASLENLSWANGKLTCGGKPVHGFVTGAEKLITDAYTDMKTALDEGKRVLFILPDGFSWEQANTFEEELSTLKPAGNTTLAASTHLSISPVALAAIVTGQTPFVNGVHFDEGESRAVLEPETDDIFKYAADRGKTAAYLEGSGNLILTSVQPQYSTSDDQIYQKALQAVQNGTDLVFVHFHEIDDANHEYGPLSSQAKSKVLVTEGYIEFLTAQFDGVVIIVPDHGHNTLYDGAGKPYGKHGMFTALDMYVPYYLFEV